MSSQAIPSYGTLLKREDPANPGTFVTVAEVKSINGPSMEVSEIDVTTHSSAASGAWKEQIASLLDAGEVSFAINLVPGLQGHKDLLADFVARAIRNWKIVFPDGGTTTWAITGFLKTFGAKAETDGVLEADLSIRVTGAPTFPA